MDFSKIAYGLSDEDKAAFSVTDQDTTARLAVRDGMPVVAERARGIAEFILMKGATTKQYSPTEAVIMLLTAAAIVHKSLPNAVTAFDHIAAIGAKTDPEIEDAINLFLKSAIDEIANHTLRVNVSTKNPLPPMEQIKRQADAHLKRKGKNGKPKPEPEAEKKNG